MTMARLLYVEGSPRKERSVSSQAADAFLKAYAAKNPSDTIDVLDTFAENLPQLDRAAFEAKYAGIAGQPRTPEQMAAWNKFAAYADRFLQADKILITVPMWNFGIPYRLKHLIDAVSHKDLLFTFDERGLNGLLTKSKAFVIYAQGITYDGDSGMPSAYWDHQRSYMEMWLKFVGVPSIQSMTIDKTLFGEDKNAYTAEAAAFGQSF